MFKKIAFLIFFGMLLVACGPGGSPPATASTMDLQALNSGVNDTFGTQTATIPTATAFSPEEVTTDPTEAIPELDLVIPTPTAIALIPTIAVGVDPSGCTTEDMQVSTLPVSPETGKHEIGISVQKPSLVKASWPDGRTYWVKLDPGPHVWFIEDISEAIVYSGCNLDTFIPPEMQVSPQQMADMGLVDLTTNEYPTQG